MIVIFLSKEQKKKGRRECSFGEGLTSASSEPSQARAGNQGALELRPLRSQKYHNNLLQPVVISSLNHVWFAPRYDFDGRSDHFDS